MGKKPSFGRSRRPGKDLLPSKAGRRPFADVRMRAGMGPNKASGRKGGISRQGSKR